MSERNLKSRLLEAREHIAGLLLPERFTNMQEHWEDIKESARTFLYDEKVRDLKEAEK